MNANSNNLKQILMNRLKSLFLLASALLIIGCNSEERVQLDQKVYNQGINITPRPLEVIEKEGEFELKPNVVFVAENEETNKVAEFFAKRIATATGFTMNITESAPTADYISLKLNDQLTVNEEGYTLIVTPEHINIEAKTAQGIFYGMQSVMQLLPAEIESKTTILAEKWTIPAVEIKDEPRFKYRGQMLDVCRHFNDIDFVKKQIDQLAMFKINTFHWHLTEDQGWRIEIKQYPKLTEISSQRVEGEGHIDGPYFFTQEEVKEVVAYAKERFIEVIPEIELPGHGVAALTAYPEYSCTGGPFEVRNLWGISNDIYCAGKEGTFEFLENIIEEVIPLFESDYFHIGGDEAPKNRWENCPDCQARIKAEGIKADNNYSAEEKLQSYFVQRIEKLLTKHGKKMIGWDEILQGGLAPSATVMSWRGERGGIAAGNMGHDVIMTPSPWVYLDAFQGDPNLAPVGIGSYTELNKTYNYDPIPEKLAEDKQHHILGIQGNIWTEYMYTPELVEYYTYPRIVAVSEIGWTQYDRKDYADFERRLDNIRVRLDMHNVSYYIPVPEQKGIPSCNLVAFVDETTLEFDTTEPVTIVYTTDGSEPKANSAVYNEPLTFTENTTLKLRSILASGKMGDVRTITIEKQDYLPAVEIEKDFEGLKAEYFNGVMHSIDQLDGLEPDSVEIIASPQKASYRVTGYRELNDEDFVSTILTGTINIEEDDVYYFKSTADQVWIDGQLLLTNVGEVKKNSRADRSIALAKGTHEIKIIRLSGIVGGWPPVWEPLYIMLRADKETKYTMMQDEFFK